MLQLLMETTRSNNSRAEGREGQEGIQELEGGTEPPAAGGWSLQGHILYASCCQEFHRESLVPKLSCCWRKHTQDLKNRKRDLPSSHFLTWLLVTFAFK